MKKQRIAPRSAAVLFGVLAVALLIGSCSEAASHGAVTVGPSGQAAQLVPAAPLPPARVPAIAQGTACPTGRRTAGWLATENARPGIRLSIPSGTDPGAADEPTDVTERAGAGRVLGYPDRWSARCGELVTVQLAGRTGTVRLVAYRMGWYGGDGARRIWTSAPVPTALRTAPSGAAAPHVVQPNWPMSVTLPIDGDWVPGFYLLVPTRVTGQAGPAGPAIPLVIRDDDGNEPILFKTSTITWNAYNPWGGWSLYHGPVGDPELAAANRARVVALHRPLIGAGYEQMQYMDLPVVRQLERLGVDVGYTTDEDVDGRPGQLSRHAEIVSGGHSEYWTTRMYDGLLEAAGAGVNLVFLGANSLWWQARLESSATATAAAPDRIAVYRSVSEDPRAARNPLQATTLWGPPPLRRDPAAVLGESHAAIGVHGGLQLMDAPDWFTEGTGLTRGSVLPGAVGNEADGYNRRGGNPRGTQVLAAGVLNGVHGPTVVSADYVSLPSGAAVFAAGTTDWACIPSGRCSGGTPPAVTSTAIGRLTRNVLLTLSRPAAGRTHPAVPVTPFTPAQLLPQLAPGAVGTYGGATAEHESD
jgi:hypothetical protein